VNSSAVAGFMHLLAQGCHKWAYGHHGPTPSIEREASRRGIHAAYGGVIRPLAKVLWVTASRDCRDSPASARASRIVSVCFSTSLPGCCTLALSP
jgi:hypothetical protein